MNFTNLTSDDHKVSQALSSDVSKSVDHFVRDVFLLILFSITGVLALVGNYVVCQIIFSKNSKLKNSTNILVGNLAISDVLGGVTIFGQYIFCSTYALDNWGLEFPCALTKSLQVLSFYMSSIIMMLIAIERYIAIMHPLKPAMPSKMIVSIAWLLLTIFVALSLGSAKIFEYFTPDRLISCRIVLKFETPGISSAHMRTLRVWGIWMGQYVVPLTITGVLYALIVRKLWNHKSVGATSQKAADTRDAKKQRVILMLIIVVVVFALCWLPLHALNFTDYVIINLEKKAHAVKPGKVQCNDTTTYFILYWLGISSCCYNPFIYWWMNPEFRRGYLGVLPSFITKHIKVEDYGSEANATELRTQSTNPSSSVSI